MNAESKKPSQGAVNRWVKRMIPVDSGARVPAAIYCGLFIAVFAALVFPFGVATTASLLGALLVGAALPGAAIVRRLIDRPTIIHYLALGTAIGLGLWAVGGMLSHLTNLFAIRWLPVVLALVVWFLPHRRPSQATANPDVPRGLPVLAAVGGLIGTVGLLPSVRAALNAQSTVWSGWHTFYGDLPFQIAITSEVAMRPPQIYPWVPDTVLSYPWLYHSAMGVWSSSSLATSAQIVLEAWPVIFALLVPTLIAIVAWDITRNRWVALIAPLLFVFTEGLVFTPGALDTIALFSVSPTRDFATIFVLLAVLALSRLLGRSHSDRWWWVGLLFLAVFVATGSKGSAMPILLGGILSAGLFLIVSRRVRTWDFLALAVFVAAVVLSTLTVLPDPGLAEALSIGPLTFVGAAVPGRLAATLVILVLLVASTLGAWIVIGRAPDGGWLRSSLLLGVVLAGVLGMSIFTHPGMSHVYFWQSAQPILVIALAWAFVLLAGQDLIRLGVIAVSIFAIAHVTWDFVQGTRPGLSYVVVGAVIVGSSVLGARLLLKGDAASGAETGRRARFTRWAVLLATAAVLTQSAQVVAIPRGSSIGGYASTEEDLQAVHSTQYAAYLYLRENAAVDDVIITNKHCRVGVLGLDCDPIWFALAAFSERHVLVDGWGYTQRGPEIDWVADEVELSDAFIQHPTAALWSELETRGVRWVYVDKRLEYSADLTDFADLVYESEWANVYRLEQ